MDDNILQQQHIIRGLRKQLKDVEDEADERETSHQAEVEQLRLQYEKKFKIFNERYEKEISELQLSLGEVKGLHKNSLAQGKRIKGDLQKALKVKEELEISYATLLHEKVSLEDTINALQAENFSLKEDIANQSSLQRTTIKGDEATNNLSLHDEMLNINYDDKGSSTNLHHPEECTHTIECTKCISVLEKLTEELALLRGARDMTMPRLPNNEHPVSAHASDIPSSAGLHTQLTEESANNDSHTDTEARSNLVINASDCFSEGLDKLLLMGASHCRGIASILRLRGLNATAIFKPNGRLCEVVECIDSLTRSYTKNDTVVVQATTNDIDGVMPYAVTIRRALDKIERISERCRIVILGMPYRYDRSDLNNDIWVANEIIKSYCKDKTIKFFWPILPRQGYTRHGLHFNTTGKRMLSETIITVTSDDSTGEDQQICSHDEPEAGRIETIRKTETRISYREALLQKNEKLRRHLDFREGSRRTRTEGSQSINKFIQERSRKYHARTPPALMDLVLAPPAPKPCPFYNPQVPPPNMMSRSTQPSPVPTAVAAEAWQPTPNPTSGMLVQETPVSQPPVSAPHMQQMLHAYMLPLLAQMHALALQPTAMYRQQQPLTYKAIE